MVWSLNLLASDSERRAWCAACSLANVLRRANAREKEKSERKKKNVNTRPVAAERERARAGKMSFVGKMQKRRPREYFTNGSQPSRALSLLAQNFIENFFCRSRANGHDGDKSGPGVVIYCSCIFRLKPEIRRSFVSQRRSGNSNQASESGSADCWHALGAPPLCQPRTCCHFAACWLDYCQYTPPRMNELQVISTRGNSSLGDNSTLAMASNHQATHCVWVVSRATDSNNPKSTGANPFSGNFSSLRNYYVLPTIVCLSARKPQTSCYGTRQLS